jgi:hypothetical protein
MDWNLLPLALKASYERCRLSTATFEITTATSCSMEAPTVLSLKLGARLLVSSLTLSQTFDSGFGVSHSVSGFPSAPVRPQQQWFTSSCPPASLIKCIPLLSANYRPDLTCYSIRSILGHAPLKRSSVGRSRCHSSSRTGANKTPASIAGISTVMSGSTRLQAANSRFEALQSACRNSLLLLPFACRITKEVVETVIGIYSKVMSTLT